VLAIDQNHVAAWSYKGLALGSLKRYEEAIQAYDRALAISANYASALRGRKAVADALKAARQSAGVYGNIGVRRDHRFKNITYAKAETTSLSDLAAGPNPVFVKRLDARNEQHTTNKRPLVVRGTLVFLFKLFLVLWLLFQAAYFVRGIREPGPWTVCGLVIAKSTTCR
jgi:tetratricopeptide (TPR) repeat protein